MQGNLAPDLQQSAQRLNENELRSRIVNPAQFNTHSIMPAYYRIEGLTRVASQYRDRTILSNQEIEDVVAFLLSLKQAKDELPR